MFEFYLNPLMSEYRKKIIFSTIMSDDQLSIKIHHLTMTYKETSQDVFCCSVFQTEKTSVTGKGRHALPRVGGGSCCRPFGME